MRCLICKINEAIQHPFFGVLPCGDCQEMKAPEPKKNVEFIPDYMREDRKAHKRDTYQPHNRGYLSKEWLTENGNTAAKNFGFTDIEIQNAQAVWNSDEYYNY